MPPVNHAAIWLASTGAASNGLAENAAKLTKATSQLLSFTGTLQNLICLAGRVV